MDSPESLNLVSNELLHRLRWLSLCEMLPDVDVADWVLVDRGSVCVYLSRSVLLDELFNLLRVALVSIVDELVSERGE